MATLWRNDVYLGRIRETAPAFGDFPLLGILEPTAAMAGVEPMMQCRNPDVPNSPMLQYVTKRHALDEKKFRERISRPLGPIEVPPGIEKLDESAPMGPGEAAAVPADKLLEIRSDEGRILDYGMISLMCFEAPDSIRAEVWLLFGFAGDTKEGWLVMAHDLSSEPET